MMQKLGTISNRSRESDRKPRAHDGCAGGRKFTNDLKAGVASFPGILNSINQGGGYVGRALRDPAEAERISKVVDNLARTTDELSRTAQNVNANLGGSSERPRAQPTRSSDARRGSKTVAQFEARRTSRAPADPEGDPRG